MKKALELALGIVTSIGGFLEVGSIATPAQAGALFGFQLAWAVALGTLCLIFLVEMSGRLAAVSRHTIADAVRERWAAPRWPPGLHPRLGRWAAALAARWSPARGRPYRIPWTHVRAAETPGGKWERWLGDEWLGRIPGA